MIEHTQLFAGVKDKHKKRNMKFLTESLEEIWDVWVVAVRVVCVILLLLIIPGHALKVFSGSRCTAVLVYNLGT